MSGARNVFELPWGQRDAARNRAPPPRARTDRLVIPLSSFVGRVEELARLRLLLEETRLLTLIGFGGIGKSRLALEFARRVETDVRLIDVSRAAKPAMLGVAIVEAIGAPLQPDRAPVEVAAELIAATPLLLVLDGCEDLLHAVSDAATYLLESCPSLRILATSRVPLNIVGETSWSLPPLSLTVHFEQGTSDAVKLFVDRARQMRPEFAPQADDFETVAKICRELDGIPLAIELAAARMRVLGLQDLGAALADRFGLLASTERSTPKRPRTLLAALRWSHDLLSQPAKRVFRRLAAFSDGCTLEAAIAVAGRASPGSAVLDALTGLVEKGLVSMREEGGSARYVMLDTIRQYALARDEESGEAYEVRARHIAYFLTLAERLTAESLMSDRDGRLRFDLELPNLRAAVMYAIESRPEAALRICSALVWHWRERGHYREGIELLERSLAATPEQTTMARARALGALAMLLGYAGDHFRSAQLDNEVIELAEASGDSCALAFGLIGQAVLIALFDPTEGRKALERAAVAAGDSGHPILLCDAHMWMVVAAALASDETRLEPRIEETLALAEPLQHRQAIAWCWWARGIQAQARAQPATMRECAERVLSGSTLVVEPVIHAFALRQLVTAATMTGEAEQLRDQVTAERERSQSAGTVAPLPELDLALAEIDLASGDIAAARTTALAMSALPLPPTGHQRWQTQHVLARTALASADRAATRKHATLLVEHALGDQRAIALAHIIEGRTALAEGDDTRAEALAYEALATFEAHGWDAGTLESLDLLGAIAIQQGTWERAARLLGCTTRVRGDRGLLRVPPEPDYWNPLTLQLSDHAPAAWEAGSELPLSGAVSYARRGRGPRDRPARGWGSLSDTELATARLAAEGLTNPQIAARLFVSRATVKAHLSHVYAKLGINNRTELTAVIVAHSDP